MNATLTLQKVLEDNFDESLRVLTEAGVTDADLRGVPSAHQALQALRDSRYVSRRSFDEQPAAAVDSRAEDLLGKAFGLLRRTTKLF